MYHLPQLILLDILQLLQVGLVHLPHQVAQVVCSLLPRSQVVCSLLPRYSLPNVTVVVGFHHFALSVNTAAVASRIEASGRLVT